MRGCLKLRGPSRKSLYSVERVASHHARGIDVPCEASLLGLALR
jgi:hypothetical protein